VHCSVTTLGTTGSAAEQVGGSALVEAVSGLMSLTGPRDGDPVPVGVPVLENLAGLFAKDAVTAALVARTRTGIGQHVETSLLEAGIAILSMSAYAYLLAGVLAQRSGSEHAFVVPWRAMPTRDGHVVIATGTERHWESVCRALNRPDLVGDTRFASMNARAIHRAELYALLDDIFIQDCSAVWMERLDAAGVAAAPVNTIDQVFADRQVRHRQMLISVDHPELGPVPHVGHPQKFSDTPSSVRRLPPGLGEHTSAVLAALLPGPGAEEGAQPYVADGKLLTDRPQ
jgi:crotonobetainyl-CoA:carnitine CoA-transferase CaiB-like acyl-CoA transferase